MTEESIYELEWKHAGLYFELFPQMGCPKMKRDILFVSRSLCFSLLGFTKVLCRMIQMYKNIFYKSDNHERDDLRRF